MTQQNAIWANPETAEILDAISRERERQDRLKAEGKFPFTCSDMTTKILKSSGEVRHADACRLSILAEEFGEVSRLVCEGVQGHDYNDLELKKELIQIAAVCVAWAEIL